MQLVYKLTKKILEQQLQIRNKSTAMSLHKTLTVKSCIPCKVQFLELKICQRSAYWLISSIHTTVVKANAWTLPVYCVCLNRQGTAIDGWIVSPLAIIVYHCSQKWSDYSNALSTLCYRKNLHSGQHVHRLCCINSKITLTCMLYIIIRIIIHALINQRQQ